MEVAMCLNHTTKRPRNFKDETGNRYGRLTVIEEAPTPSHITDQSTVYWLCRCDCGKNAVVRGHNLRSEHTYSCGCYCKQQGIAANTKHGLRTHADYDLWRGMKDRCYNPNHSAYEYYGGRGVTVCDRWRHSFENFLADMGPRPSTKHSIDRIDTSGSYSPENCRWATQRQQMRNTRSNHYLTYNGKTLMVSEWAEELGISRNTIAARLHTGKPIEDVLHVGHLPNDGRFKKGRRNP
jgi:hypothetical protein